MRKFLVPALMLATAGQATAQSAENQPSFWSLLTFDRLAGVFVNQMVVYARVLADIRYDGLDVDAMGASIRVVGLEVAPKIPGLPNNTCMIRADSAQVRGAPLDQIETTRVQITMDNAQVSAGCFPPDVGPVMAMTGSRNLNLDRLDVSISYHMPSGGAQVQVHASIDRVARIVADADIHYISYRMDFDREEPEVAVLLNAARIQIEDRGAAKIAMQFMPPALRDPVQLTQVVQGNLTQALRGTTGQISDAQQLFINDAAAMAAKLVQGSRQVVLETNIADAPLRLDENSGNNPQRLFDQLAPRIAASTLALDAALPLTQIAAAQSGALSGEDALATGRALINGVGAPRNIALALDVLRPLADNGEVEAAFLMARALAGRDAKAAYGYALKASAGGHGPSLALMDRIENTLPFGAVISAQDDALPAGSMSADAYASVGDMRAAALAHMTGSGMTRSFRAAYFWAALAAAAGDSSAAALRDDLDERMRRRGLADQWTAETQSIEAAVLDAWTSGAMPARLKVE